MSGRGPDAAGGSVQPGSDAGPAGTAVLVLGPEGAGLAALAGLLGLLGCDLPRDLVAVGPHDGRGAWESAAVAGRPWPGLADARAALEAAFGSAPLPLLKGAALARGLPGWLAALEDTGRGAVAVLAFGLPPEGADEEAWDAWARDVLRAEGASRGVRRAVVARDRLLADWRGHADGLGRALGLAWPAWSAGEAAAEAFVASAQAVFASSAPAAPPSDAARALVEVLARWGEAGEDVADRPELDRIAETLGLEDEARPEAAPPPAQAGNGGDAALVGMRAALAAAEQARTEAEARLTEAATLLARSERLRLDGVAAAEARARQAEAAARSAAAEGSPDDRLAEIEAELAAARHERDQVVSALRQRGHESDDQVLARVVAEAALVKARAEHAADLRRMDRLRRDVAVLKRDALGALSARLAELPPAASDPASGGAAEAAALQEAVATFGEPRDLARQLAEATRRAEKQAEHAQTLAARLKDAERRIEKRAADADASAGPLEGPGGVGRVQGVGGLAARLQEAERQVRHAQELAAAAQAEVEALRRSTSWRLTKPLRSLLGALRRA